MFSLSFNDPSFPTNIGTVKVGSSHPLLRPAITLVETDVRAIGILGEVVVQAALAHPTWNFVVAAMGTHRLDGANYSYPTRVRVYRADDTEAGVIEAHDTYVHNQQVELRNKRISKQMQRGDCLKTSKLDKALKLIKTHFSEPSAIELMSDARERLTQGMASIAIGFRNEFASGYKTLANELMDFLVDNIDEIYTRNPHLAAKLDKAKFVDSLDNHNISNNVIHAPPIEQLTVVLQGDKYVLRRPNSPVMVKTSDQLPPEVRTAIGLLKLVSDGQFVRDVGFRLAADTFLVLYAGELN